MIRECFIVCLVYITLIGNFCKNILLGQCPKFGFFIFLRDLFTGGVLSDQAEADEDTSLKNRALMAIGTG